jgi:hypothetical protein
MFEALIDMCSGDGVAEQHWPLFYRDQAIAQASRPDRMAGQVL